MRFVEGLSKAYNTKWSYINSFRVYFALPASLTEASNWNETRDGREINLHVVSIDTPQFQNQLIEQFVANKWRVHNGRDELYRFTITFRDRDRMDLYRKFVAMYNQTKHDYFDNVKMSVLLYKDADYAQETEKQLFSFDDTLIESVSQLQFNNTTENQIAEFTVGFKCVTPTPQL